MRMNRKGQVTIPAAIRARLGLVPGTEIELEVAGDAVRIAAAIPSRSGSAGEVADGGAEAARDEPLTRD
jgi:AbrB family looped-hinge helix DNA binding protein